MAIDLGEKIKLEYSNLIIHLLMTFYYPIPALNLLT